MCDFCKTIPNQVYDYTQELLVGIAHNKKGEGALLILAQGRENAQSVVVKITNCPWCGDKIK